MSNAAVACLDILSCLDVTINNIDCAVSDTTSFVCILSRINYSESESESESEYINRPSSHKIQTTLTALKLQPNHQTADGQAIECTM